MINELFKRMMKEKHDFYHYVDLYHDVEDTPVKNTLKNIAEQEMHHYKALYDIVFKEDPNYHWTELEKTMCHQAKEWYKDMEEELTELK